MIRRATIDDANAIGTVHMTTWRTSYVGLMPQHVLDNRSIERSQERWRNRSQAYQRRGLGRQLVATIAQEFAPQHTGLMR